jgi:hypothetical protein
LATLVNSPLDSGVANMGNAGYKTFAKRALWDNYNLFAQRGYENEQILTKRGLVDRVPRAATEVNISLLLYANVESESEGERSESHDGEEIAEETGMDVEREGESMDEEENEDEEEGEGEEVDNISSHSDEVIERWDGIDYEAKFSSFEECLALLPVLGWSFMEGYWTDFPPSPFYGVERTVIVDLDHDVVTIDAEVHFPLNNLPPRFLDDWNPKDLADLTIPTPPPNEELIAEYASYSPTIIDCDSLIPEADSPRRAVQSAIMNDFWTQNFYHLRAGEFAPSEMAFKKMVFALIKLASWNQIELQRGPSDVKKWRWLNQSYELGERFRYIDPPSSDMYFVPGGLDSEVLIHLATHLVQDYKAAITRVVKFVQKSNKLKTTAMIISLGEVIVVTVDLTNDTSISVLHTNATDFRTGGFELLSAIISPPEPFWFRPLNSNLPADILEPIFEEFCKSNGTATDLISWRLTCKEFNKLAERKLIRLNNLNIINFGRSEEVKSRPQHTMHFVKNEAGICLPWYTYHFHESDGPNELRWRVLDRENQQWIGACGLILEGEDD